MSFQNIPKELQLLPQWLVWQLEDIGASKPTKIPYNPKTGHLASVSESNSWSTFEHAVEVSKNYSGIGFVFTDEDPYCFIDLDDTLGDVTAYDRQIKIYREFNSYSEVSPSGKGLHIIGKGKLLSGRRRSFIEIYSSKRYATFTGNIYNDAPIVDCQDKLQQLWEQMGAGVNNTIYHGDSNEKFDDKAIIDIALNAVNGEKFKSLFDGKWNEIYESQSHADFAFIDIIAFYTQNKKQIERIFRTSTLGKRDKANRRDYIEQMIFKSFDKMLPPIDIDGFKNALELKIAEQQQLKLPLIEEKKKQKEEKPEPKTKYDKSAIPIPPGLMGDIARFVYQAAPRPVPEIALGAAIGLMAGITGRAYNISGTGLNQYLLVLANTGSGKEGMASGIDKLMNTIRLQVPTSTNYIGPAEISSGQALLKYINRTSQCFVSILGEFGLRLQNMSRYNASAADVTLKRMLLDLYAKSGHGQVYRPSVYSDKEKNIEATMSPCFSILGESVPENFYSSLSEEMIAEGLLPRFVLIEYSGPRPELNNDHLNAVPSMMLTEQLASLVANCETIMHAKKVINIDQSVEAFKLTDKFDKFATRQINISEKDIVKQLWNRAHVKVLKLAGLIAVGVNMIQPTILPEYVVWAINIVQNDIKALSEKFELGLIGANTAEVKQASELKRIIQEYVFSDWVQISKYFNNSLMHNDRVIPYAFISRRLISAAAYKNDKSGSTSAIKRAIQILIDSDRLREISKMDLIAKYGTTQKAYMISDNKLLEAD